LAKFDGLSCVTTFLNRMALTRAHTSDKAADVAKLLLFNKRPAVWPCQHLIANVTVP